MSTKPTVLSLLRRSNGEPLTISAAPIGAGGEARIYPAEARQVAKIYHEPTPERAAKLVAMLANPPDEGEGGAERTTIAWPTDILEDRYRRPVGYLMPRVSGMRPIFHFYNPLTRRQESPLSNYLYLHRTARNLAGAFRALHTRGYVVGDVNESNILASETALVTLVDTDSFQVRDEASERVFRCPVGKPEYTPPELQGKPFATIDRAPENDLFGLAVLIFQLLMEGTHPFAGIYLGGGDPPAYEERIAAGQFTYGTRRVPYQRMPPAPPFEILAPTLRQLFVRCFEDGHRNPAARPDALTWQNALREAEAALRTCTVNPQHRFGDHLSACPWCARRDFLKGRDPFPTPEEAPQFRRVAPRPRPASPAREAPRPAPSRPTPAPATTGTSSQPRGNVPQYLPPRPPGGRVAMPPPAAAPVTQGVNAPPPGAFYNFVNYGGYSSYAAWLAAHQHTPSFFDQLPRSKIIWASAGLALLTLFSEQTFWAAPTAVICGIAGIVLATRQKAPGRWLAACAIAMALFVATLYIAIGKAHLPTSSSGSSQEGAGRE